MGTDSYDELSWMSEEMKNDLRKRNNIVVNEDFDSLFELDDNSDFSIALYEILVNRYDKNPNSLNAKQLNLFLCMHIENAGQADSILSFLQEWFPNQKDKVIESLNNIGAINSAKIIEKAIKLIPKDNTWFFENSDEESEKKMDKLDSEFSDYPDGFLRDLYRKYAEANKQEIIK